MKLYKVSVAMMCSLLLALNLNASTPFATATVRASGVRQRLHARLHQKSGAKSHLRSRSRVHAHQGVRLLDDMQDDLVAIQEEHDTMTQYLD